MKITKRQLRRIIKEEKAKILAESAGSADISYEPLGPDRHIITVEMLIREDVDLDYLLNDIDDTLEGLFSTHGIVTVKSG